jgi:hypothetical protein
VPISRCIAALLFSALFLSVPALCAPEGAAACHADPPARRLVYGPEYYFNETFLRFFNPKNDSFQNRYFLENSLALEAAFLSLDRRWFFLFNVVVNFDMGRQAGAILLDPRETDMGFGPTFEYRQKQLIIQASLDHHCFHQIDREEWNTLYWNKLFICAASPNLREGAYREFLRRPGEAGWDRRLSWQAGYGYFVHEFFGLLDTSALSWGNAYIHELVFSARWAFLRGPWHLLFATGQSRARVDRAGRWLWTESLGCELAALKGDFGFSLFVNWIVADRSIKRENRDRLVEAGFRVYR